jgi:hypothetical protein
LWGRDGGVLVKLYIRGSDATRGVHPNGKPGTNRLRVVGEFVLQLEVQQQPAAGRHSARSVRPDDTGDSAQFLILFVKCGDHQDDLGVARFGVSGGCPSQVVAIDVNVELLRICRRGRHVDMHAVIGHGACVRRSQVGYQPSRWIHRVDAAGAVLKIVAGAGYYSEAHLLQLGGAECP